MFLSKLVKQSAFQMKALQSVNILFLVADTFPYSTDLEKQAVLLTYPGFCSK